MQIDNVEFKRIVNHRLEENWKSFKLLFDMKHYGNCISIMCQELDQMISLLFILTRNSNERKHLINLSVNSHKWYFLDYEDRKQYIDEKEIIKYADTLVGWDRSIYRFGLSFSKLSINFNYLMKDPLAGMSEIDRKQILEYIKEYHDPMFLDVFELKDLVPLLEKVFKSITDKIGMYLNRL